jgi:hypothetical protein
MKIIKSFAVYRCTQCGKFHISNMDYESVFESHSRFQDPHGIVTRYGLSDRIDAVMFAAAALFSVGWFVAVVFRAVSAWPNKPEWRFPFGVTAALCFSAIWLIFVHDQTFGPSPWRKEQPVRKSVRWLWDSGMVAGLTFMGAGLLLAELALRGGLATLLDWALLAGCIILAEAFVLMKVFAKRVLTDADMHQGTWISLLFWAWVILASGLWAGRPHEPWGKMPWDKAAANALEIVVAFAIFSLLLVGIIKATRYCAEWLLVQLVRGWRHAERIAEEKEANGNPRSPN